MKKFQEYCLKTYQHKFDSYLSEGLKPTDAQRNAIKETSIESFRKFPKTEPSEIWKQIYVAHVHNKSGVKERAIIESIISADNSWKKSSGHAFEELICDVGNLFLEDKGIKLILQKELNTLLKAEEINNEVRDISWLKEQIKTNIFDIYAIIEKDKKRFAFSCIQSKTSIRDRVTRDREPSINAMNAFFLSLAVVLDGEYLKNPKFQYMVNGKSSEYKINGWHAMYVLTNFG